MNESRPTIRVVVDARQSVHVIPAHALSLLVAPPEISYPKRPGKGGDRCTLCGTRIRVGTHRCPKCGAR